MIKNKKKLTAVEMPEFHKDIESMPLEDKLFIDKSVAIEDKIMNRIEELGLTQKELADKMNRTEAQISLWLSGGQNFRLRSICKFEAALDFEIVSITANREADYDIIVNEIQRLQKQVEFQQAVIEGMNRRLESSTSFLVVIGEMVEDLKGVECVLDTTRSDGGNMYYVAQKRILEKYINKLKKCNHGE